MATIADLDVRLRLTDMVSDKLEGLGKKIGEIGKGLTAAVTTPLLGVGVGMVKLASDLNESTSAVMTTFGDGAQQVLDWSKTSATSLGLSRNEYLSTMAVMGTYGDALGYNGQQTAEFGNELIGAAADLGSFYNAATPDVLGAMQAALRGEFDPLERFGIRLNQATLEQYAMEQGISDGSAALTDQQKILATQNYILDHLGAAQGDFARTSGGLANSMKILKATLMDTGAQLGQVLLPYVLQGVQAFQSFLGRIQSLSPGMQKLVVVFGLAAAALGPLLIAIGAMLPALSLLLGPLGLVIAAIGLLSAAYIGNWFGFGDAVDWVAGKVAKFGKLFFSIFSANRKIGNNVILSTFAALGVTLSKLTGINLMKFFAVLYRGFMRPLKAVQKIGDGLLDFSKALFDGDWDGALDGIRKAFAGVGDLLTSLPKLAGEMLRNISTGFAPLDSVIHRFGGILVSLGRLFQEIFQGDFDGALKVARHVIDQIGGLFTALGKLIMSTFDAIPWGTLWDGLLSAGEAAISALGGLLGDIAGWVLNIGAPALGGWIVEQAGNLWGWLKDTAVPGFFDLVGDIAAWTLNVAAPELGGWIAGLVGGIWGWIKGLLGLGEATTGDGTGGPEADNTVTLGSWILDTGIPTLLGWIKDVAGDIWSGLIKLANWSADRTFEFGIWFLEVGAPTILGWLVDNKGGIWTAIKILAGWPVYVAIFETLEWTLFVGAPALTGWLIDHRGEIWTAIKILAGWPVVLAVFESLSWTLSVGAPALVGWLVDHKGDIWTAVKILAGWPVVLSLYETISWTLSVGTPAVVGWLVDHKDDIWTAIKILSGWAAIEYLWGLGGWTLNIPTPDVIGWMKAYATDLWNAIKRLVPGWPDSITGSVDISLDGIFSVAEGFLDKAAGAIASAAGWVWNAGKFTWNLIVDVTTTLNNTDSTGNTNVGTGTNGNVGTSGALINGGLGIGGGAGAGGMLDIGKFIDTSGVEGLLRESVSNAANTIRHDKSLEIKASIGADTEPMEDALGIALKLGVAWNSAIFDKAVLGAQYELVDKASQVSWILGNAWNNATFDRTVFGAQYDLVDRASQVSWTLGNAWAASRHVGTFDATYTAVGAAYSTSFVMGNTWAGQVFTARFSIDTSPLDAAYQHALAIAQAVRDIMPSSPAKRGPLAFTPSFAWIANALTNDLSGMPMQTASVMDRVASEFNRRTRAMSAELNSATYGGAASAMQFTNYGPQYISASDPREYIEDWRQQAVTGARP